MIWLYSGFILFILLLLALDLGVFHRHSHVIKMKEALGWSAFWIALGLLFSVFIYFGYQNQWLGLGLTREQLPGTPATITIPEGARVIETVQTDAGPATLIERRALDSVGGGPLDGANATVKYLTGYIVEKSLSVDNIFVIAMLFTFFAIPQQYQHRVLFWGIIGALLMRGVMIGIGAALIQQFHWVIYVFGGFLILTGIKMLVLKEGDKDFSKNPVVKLTKKLFPVTDKLHGEHFLVRAGSAESREAAVEGAAAERDEAVEHAKAGAIMLTPLALVLILVEFTDLIFAVDSIPAIFAITGDPFIVFTSNVFAILGLRSLYFALAGLMHSFKYLKPALAVILLVIGTKMLLLDWVKGLLGDQYNFYLLGVVLGILAVGVIASLLAKQPPHEESAV